MKILTPFAYCAFRMSGNEDTSECPRLASGRVEGMPFCEGHVELVEKLMGDSGCEFVKDEILELKKRG